MDTLILLVPVAIVLILVVVFFLQSRIRVLPYEEYFPIRQVEPAYIERRLGNRIVLRWDEGLSPEKITLTDSPEDGAVIETWNPEEPQRRLVLTLDREHFRPFFHIHRSDGNDLVVSTRFQPFERVRNFRDIGGYFTAEGRQINWGRLYRSGQIGSPTDTDLELLKKLELKTIIDLRDDSEVERLPDNVPGPVQHRRVFITDSVMVRRASVIVRRHRLSREFTESYKEMIIEQGAAGIGEVLQILADPDNLPAVIHCTAGKDRAGVVTALILSVLGVPDETIVADYTLSNHFAEAYIWEIERRISRMRWIGMRKEHFFPMAAARPAVMESTLAYLRETYGSAQAYLLNRAQVTQEDLDRLKENLL